MATGEALNIYELDKFNPEDFFIPLTFSVADFRDISTRNGNYSKTVEIPSTKKNDSLLGHSFDITAEGFFDRNKKQKAFIERDGITYLDGFMQLKAVELRNGKPYLYKIVLFSSLSEWASLIGDESIRTLNYSTIDYNQTNIEASWENNGLENEYIFPAINYDNFTGSDSSTNIEVEDFLPGVFIYHILKETFKEIGYELKPGVFYDRKFHNLFLPSCISSADASLKFLKDNGGRIFGNKPDVYTPHPSFTDMEFVLVDSLTPTNFSTDPARFIAPFTTNVYGYLVVTLQANQILLNTDATVRVAKFDNSTSTTTEVASINKTIPRGRSETFTLDFDNIAMDEDDQLLIQFKVGSALTSVKVEYASFFVFLKNGSLSDGDKVGVGDFLPDIKRIDLVKAVMQMFNLYHFTDERNKTVEFFTRDEFYKPISEARDWTGKLDISKPIEIEQLDDRLNRDLEFVYEYDENDDLQVEFRDTYGITYGNYTEKLENEFLKGSKKVADIPFSPTIGSGTLDQTNGSTIDLPWIKTNYRSLGDPIEVKDRILVYDGLVDWNWTFESGAKTQIPFSYFTKRESGFNDLSLSFRSYRLFNGSIRSEDRGLVEVYYNNQIKMFNNSRLVTAYLKISPVDVLNLDFRKPIYIDGVYYYLNKIEDYKTGTEETVKVELINIP